MHWTENPAMQVRVLPVAQINSVVEEWFISSALGAEARRFESGLRYKKIVPYGVKLRSTIITG
jgi:hypothetical protein